ncbi:three-helix bundle dimerization domain-containing protein [Jatrophihabitans sp. DSM 45814]
MTALEDHSTATAEIEGRAIEKLIERLRHDFPMIPLVNVVLAIEVEYQRYDECRIREFIPILVERSVREELTRELSRP